MALPKSTMMYSPPQEAVRNLHREAREAVGKVGGSDDDLPTQLEADQLDRLSGRTRLGSPSSSVMSEHLATDYRAVSGLEAPTPSHHVSAYSYAPPDPQLVQQVEMARSGASIPRVFPGQEDFGVPVGQDKASGGTGSLYILDASWEDFVAQLGF
jgi:hypothetical protein